MTMRNGRCHWSRALYQILVCLLMQKRPLFVKRIRLDYWANNFIRVVKRYFFVRCTS